MKIKIIVIDPELSTRTKRILAAIAIPAVLLGGAAVAWAGLPHTWSAGETLTAQNLTDDFDALDKRLAAVKASAPTAWATYACQVVDRASGLPVGGDASTCIWRKNGGSIEVRIYSLFASAPSPSHIMSWPVPPGVTIDYAALPDGNSFRSSLGSGQFNPAGGAVNLVFVGPVQGQPRVNVAAEGGADALTTSEPGVGPGAFVSFAFTEPVTP